MKILSLTSTMLAACVMLMTGAASASTLSSRPSTLMFEGPMTYGFDQGFGVGFVSGSTSDALYLFELSFVFDGGTQGENLRDVNALLTDAMTFDTALSAIDLEEIEIGAGFAALLLGDVDGPLASGFNGGKLLLILRDPNFPQLTGNETFELRSLDPTTVIPLPAAAPLMLAGVSALVLVARRRTAAPGAI